jgi:hypothetical protein
MLPLSSLSGYKDFHGQPIHHNCGALQVDVSEEPPASWCIR